MCCLLLQGGFIRVPTVPGFWLGEDVVGSVPGSLLHFTTQILVLIPAPLQPSPSPIPGGSRVQRCHKSWRTNVMEKLGMQLLGSAGFKVKHEFIPLESNSFSRTW